MIRDPDRNVVGGDLLPCSTEPLTGFYRDSCCATGPDDLGSHTVCAVMTEEFLDFSKLAGNDLSTPRPSGALQASCRETSGVAAARGGSRRTAPESPRPSSSARRTNGR